MADRAEAVARVLADHGFPDSDAIRRQDMDAAADAAGVDRPVSRDDRAAVADAYDALVQN